MAEMDAQNDAELDVAGNMDRLHLNSASDDTQISETPRAESANPFFEELSMDSAPAQVTDTSSAQNVHAANENSDYIAPVEDPYGKAMKYLSKHDIFGLFQGITAGIVYARPEAPLDFMVSELEKMQEQDRLQKGVIRQASDPELSVSPSQQQEISST